MSVILAISASLLLSLTVIPALAAKLYERSSQKSQPAASSSVQSSVTRAQSHNSKRFNQPPGFWHWVGARPGRNTFLRLNATNTWWQTGWAHPRLTQFYRASLRRLFARPLFGVLLALILPIAGFIQVASLTEQFFPPAGRDQLQIELELPIYGSMRQTEAIAQQARELMLAHPEVMDVHWFLGRSAPRFYYNLLGTREQYANYAQGMVQLSGIAEPTLINTLQAEMDQALPAARVLVRQLEQGPPFEAPVELRVYGPNLEHLTTLGEQARASLVKIPQVTHTRDSLSEVLPQLQLQVDEDEARLAGLDNTSVAQQLDAILEGNLGGSILEDTEALPVRVRITTGERGDLSQITSLDLLPNSASLSSSNAGSVNTVPLSALGTVELTPENSVITRRNGRRFNLVQGYIAAGVLPAEVVSTFQQNLNADGFELPPGYWTEIGGEAEERDSALAGMLQNIGTLTVLMVATLVLALSSFRLALIIGVVAIGSIGLGFLSLGVFNYPFGFMGIVGTFGLVGVAVNDSVVVMAALRADPAARRGDPRAVREVVIHSTRHVIATTLTTMIGFVPLVLGGGGFWPPLAIAIAGGIGGATLLALYFVPSAYLLLRRQQAKTTPSKDGRYAALSR
ncbi:MAG: efflux RND transporter permease subunit [Cyanothece sp. SIO1E1]|nr:efflux RND transporter permease subunit [Cyanothece sp. SIO1E1]